MLNLSETTLDDFDFGNILLDEKSYEISYKTLTGAKPLCIRFDKIDLLQFMIALDI